MLPVSQRAKAEHVTASTAQLVLRAKQLGFTVSEIADLFGPGKRCT
jgi:hypothetical protein